MTGLGHNRKSSVGLGMSAFGGKADSLPDPSACPLIAISGHSLVSQVLLGVLGPDRLGAGLHLRSLGTAVSFVQQSGIVLKALGHVGVRGPQGLLPDCQSALV